KVWAIPPAAAYSLPHADAVLGVAASADGKRILTAGADKTVLSWNLASPAQPERKFGGHTAAVRAVALSPNGQILASAGDDEVIRFWNQTNGQQTDLIGAHAGPIVSLAFNPNNQQLLSASSDGSLKLWTLPVAAPKALSHPDAVTSAV